MPGNSTTTSGGGGISREEYTATLTQINQRLDKVDAIAEAVARMEGSIVPRAEITMLVESRVSKEVFNEFEKRVVRLETSWQRLLPWISIALSAAYWVWSLSGHKP